MKMSLTKNTNKHGHCVENTTTETNSARSLSRKNSQFSVSEIKQKDPKTMSQTSNYTLVEKTERHFFYQIS